VREAASHLAKAFRVNLKPSPIHLEGSAQLQPFARALFQAFENVDPATKRQRAITPKLLRAMYRLAGVGLELTHDSPLAVIAEVAIAGFFFAMRSCECTTTPTPGRTKTIDMLGMIFRDKSKKEIQQDSAELSQSEYVSYTFVDQKNKEKNDTRSQQRTSDPVLCPVRRSASLVERIRRLVPNHKPTTTMNTICSNDTVLQLSSEFLRERLRVTCTALGGKPVFGYSAADIGTKSLRSGAAMSLFLMNHSTERIMLLGRWKSDAFLVYIRPQVLEWTNNMSRDMILHDSFLDVSGFDQANPDLPRTRPRRFNGPDSTLIFPSLHLGH
jgi:hypothetical protein